MIQIRSSTANQSIVYAPGLSVRTIPEKEKEMFDKLSQSQPIGRMGRSEEVANLALYLSSDEASFITGTDFPIDGGFIKLNG